MKKYVNGLVVGKFCPLHLGHEFVIRTALDSCENVIILSYTTEHSDMFDANIRSKWLNNIPHDITERLNVHVLDSIVPIKDDAPGDQHREFCADYLLNTLETTVDAVFASEDYGQGFADYLSAYFTKRFPSPVLVDYIEVDRGREKFPISGTTLRDMYKRGDIRALTHFIPDRVAAIFSRKLLFLGAESTGKSTLVEVLAKDMSVAYVPEYGRELFDLRKGNLRYSDMVFIGETQVVYEDCAAELFCDKYLLCDTSPLTTAFYSKEWFGRVDPKLDMLAKRKYYKTYLCAPDFPMVQDGTRQDESFRTKGHQFYLDALKGTEYTLLTGTLEERIKQVKNDLAYLT